MAQDTVRLTNGQRWTAQQFLDYYRSARISSTPSPDGDALTPVDVDRSWYMDEGPGRYYHPGMFPIIKNVINRRDLAPGTYDLWQLASKNKQDDSVKASISHYFTDPKSEDFKTRAFVFGNESARMSGQVVVNQDGSKTFHGVEIRPFDTNFDFEHNTWNPFIEIPRELARRKYDPESQGIKYDIRYRGPGPNGGTGRIYDPFTDSQLNAALSQYPRSGVPWLLSSITGKPALPFVEEHRQYLDQTNGDQSWVTKSNPVQSDSLSKDGASGVSNDQSVSRVDRGYGINSSAPISKPNAPAAPFVFPGSSSSGDIASWFAALAGVDPKNPTRPASPPLDNELRDFYRNDPARFLQLPR